VASALGLAAASTPAFAVLNTSSFSVLPTSSSVPWDINGDGTTDFNLFGEYQAAAHMTFTTPGTTNRTGMRFTLPGLPSTRGLFAHKGAAGNGFLGTIGGGTVGGILIAPLTAGAVIGDNIPAGAFHLSHNTFTFTRSHSAQDGLHFGDQLIGFEFTATDGTHYGWADVLISDGSLTVNEWAYNATPNASIPAGEDAGPVPEPAQSAAALGLLALGAAGVSAYKRRRQKAA
jgi:MYXO-CTERM domain-containing protein